MSIWIIILPKGGIDLNQGYAWKAETTMGSKLIRGMEQ